MSNIDVNQAILIRDMIDMAREYKNDSNILEYISSFCFVLDEIFDECKVKNKDIDWNEIFSYYDQKYYNLSQGDKVKIDEARIDKIYDTAVQIIKKNQFDSINSRQDIIEYIKSQVIEYKNNPEKGEQIAYDITGLLCLRVIGELTDDDPLDEILTLASELELPEQHRSNGTSWEMLIEQVEKL